jgi:hypothetical protein
MASGTKPRPRYVKIKDSSGNEWYCPMDVIKNIKQATEEELNECVDLDVITHTLGLTDEEH